MQKGTVKADSTHFVRSLLNFLHFFSMYSRMVLIVRMMARMRLPKATVPK